MLNKPTLLNISCLPVAGIENPYQLLMMKGLESSSQLHVKHGVEDKFLGILRTAIRDRPDYIHFDWVHQYYYRRTKWMTYLFYPLFIFQVWIVTRFFNAQLVWTLHNIMPHDSPKSGPYLAARRYFAKKAAWIRVFSPSTVTKASKILEVGVEKFKIIPEGSYVGYYPDTIGKKQARSYFELREDDMVFLFFGSLRPYKGVEDLITHFKKMTDAHLIIAGNCKDEKYRSELLSLIGAEENVTFHPNGVSADEIQNYMSVADCVVLPFKKIENSGSAILAMGFGKPVIAPNKGVIPYRLNIQKELLFNDDLAAALQVAKKLGQSELEKLGRKNLLELEKYKWSDYALEFV